MLLEDKRLAELTHTQTAGFLSMCSHAKRYRLIDQRVAPRSERIKSIAQHERRFHVLHLQDSAITNDLQGGRVGGEKWSQFQVLTIISTHFLQDIKCWGSWAPMVVCVCVCVRVTISQRSLLIMADKTMKRRQPQGLQIPSAQTNTHTLYMGAERRVTIISLLQALLLKLISNLKEMSCDRTRSE